MEDLNLKSELNHKTFVIEEIIIIIIEINQALQRNSKLK